MVYLLYWNKCIVIERWWKYNLVIEEKKGIGFFSFNNLKINNLLEVKYIILVVKFFIEI